MDGMRIQIANMSPERYARSAKRSAEVAIKSAKAAGIAPSERAQRLSKMSLEELADAQRKAQRERSRDVDATVEGTYGYMSGLGITREQYERMVERLYTFEYVIAKSTSLEFE